MPNQILQVDENMLETKLDRLVSEKVEQLLNAMLDAEADEITGACRRSYTLECKTNAARRALEGEPLARVARDAGCTPTSVYQWMRRYRSEGILGLMDRRNAPMPAEPMPAAGDDVCFASMFVRQVRQCFSVVWADGFPRCRHRFPVM